MVLHDILYYIICLVLRQLIYPGLCMTNVSLIFITQDIWNAYSRKLSAMAMAFISLMSFQMVSGMTGNAIRNPQTGEWSWAHHEEGSPGCGFLIAFTVIPNTIWNDIRLMKVIAIAHNFHASKHLISWFIKISEMFVIHFLVWSYTITNVQCASAHLNMSSYGSPSSFTR